MRSFGLLVLVILGFISLAIVPAHSASCPGITVNQLSVNLQPQTLFDIKNSQVVWIKNSTNGFVVSGDGSLFKIKKDKIEQINLPKSQSGVKRIWPTSNPQWFLFEGSNQIWTTQDGGSTFILATDSDSSIISSGRGFQFHPLNPSIVLTTSLTLCYETSQDYCMSRLMLSTNFGKDWTELATYVESFNWAAQYYDSQIESNVITVLFTKFPAWYGIQDQMPKQNMRLYRGIIEVGSDWKTEGGEGDEDGIAFEYTRPTDPISDEPIVDIIVPDPIAFASRGITSSSAILFEKADGDNLNTFSSTDNGETLKPTNIPSHISMKLLGYNNERLFAHIITESGEKWGSLYTSLNSLSDYSNPIPQQLNDVRDGELIVDWTTVSDIKSIKITNAIDKSKNSIYSKITFDNGQTWSNVAAPSNASCKDCRLNLFGETSSFPTPFSNPRSPGFVLANGNTGKYLDEDSANAFVSRDGGLSWHLIFDQAHIFSIGNLGSIFVVAESNSTSGTIKYSDDQGVTWVKCQIFETGHVQKIDWIFSQGLKFIVSGYDPIGKQGIAAQIDLSKYYTKDCGDVSDVDSEGSNYEYWSPSSSSSSQCILGKKETFIRRKQLVDCSTNADLSSYHNITICPCSDQDFECNVGYVLSGSECVKDTKYTGNLTETSPPSHCIPSEGYYVQEAYRIVRGSVCDPNMPGSVANKYLIHLNCPSKKNTTGWFAVISMTIFSLVGLLLAILIVIQLKCAKVREYIPESLSEFASPSREYTSINDEERAL